MARPPEVHPRRPRSGFSLVEIMFAVVLVGVIMAVALNLLALSVDNYNQDAGRNEASGALRIAAEYLKRDLRNASQVVGSLGAFATASDTVVLCVPSYDSSGIIPAASDFLVYRRLDGNLTRTVYASEGSQRPGEVDRIIARKVSSLQFTFLVHDFFIGDGVNRVFTLSAEWLQTPDVNIDGEPAGASASFDFTTGNATLGYAPPEGATIEFVYATNPASAAALASVSEVRAAVETTSAEGDHGVEQLVLTTRLRNKL